jgi:hypothetical protein
MAYVYICPYFVVLPFPHYSFVFLCCFANTFPVEHYTITGRYLRARKTASDTNSSHTGDDDDDIAVDSSSPSSIEIITKLAANLVRQLLADMDLLFVSQPLTIE